MSCGRLWLRKIAADDYKKSRGVHAARLNELGKLGYMTTPVTLVDGEVVVGFDRAKLENLLRVS